MVHVKNLALGLVLSLLGSYQGVFAAANNNFATITIREGDNAITLLRRNGFSQSESNEVLRRAPGLGNLMLTTDLSYVREIANRRVSLKIYDQATDQAYLVWRESGQVGTQTLQPKWAINVGEVEGTVHGSLMESLLHKVPSNWIASRFMDAFRLDHKLGVLPAGAHFKMKFEKKYEEGHFVKYGEVLDATLDYDGHTLQKHFVRLPGGGVFINQHDLLSERPLYAPVSYLKIASEFQINRRHPVTHRVQPHLGIDFEMPSGAPVYAARKGVVARYGRSRAAGNYVVLSHGNGIETAYDHLRRLEPTLHSGQPVRVGQKIAEVGCTGYCTRPHLHFALRLHGRMVNPAPFLKAFPWSYEESLQKRVATTQD